MITREMLDAQRELFLKGRERAASQIAEFNGALQCLDYLLSLLDEDDAEAAQTDNTAAIEAAEENTNG